MNFRSSRSRTIHTLIRRAKQTMASGNPIPLDLSAALDAAGIDLKSLERKA